MCYLSDIYMISLFLGECKGLLGKPFAGPTNCAASLLKSLPLTSWVKQHRPRLCMSEAQQRQEKTQRNEQQESGKAGKRGIRVAILVSRCLQSCGLFSKSAFSDSPLNTSSIILAAASWVCGN